MLGSGVELQVPTIESWADEAQTDTITDGSMTGGAMGGGRQQAGGVHGGVLGGVTTASCFLGPELQCESWADVGLLVAVAQHLWGPTGTGQLGSVVDVD